LRILSVDTSTPAGSIVLADDERIVGEVNIDSAETHSVRLLSGIDHVLKSLGLTLWDVHAFAVISGPGSFTGIRIGLTTIKGLAETTGKPTIPITAFEAWAEKFPEETGVIVPLIDARRGEVYATVFERVHRELNLLSRGTVESPSQLLLRLTHEHVLFVGDGATRYGELIAKWGRPFWRVAPSDAFLGRPMSRLACRKAMADTFTSASDLKAYYLRKSDAELYWKEK
jgi:tRNA threonylcarbamoyladenosine biosynthesis protein TsaB